MTDLIHADVTDEVLDGLSDEDYEKVLAHYGVPGMKWGKQKNAQRKATNNAIREARGRQGERAAKLNTAKMARLNATSRKGKQHLDNKIADLDFALKNNPDSMVASRKTTGEKWLKAGTITAKVGLAMVGLNGLNSALNNEFAAGAAAQRSVQDQFREAAGE